MKVRVRFAPSPTGFLHIGGARTALFNWLYARHTGGQFILRIEDTDAARNTQEAVDVILDGLRWLGLDWDEGPLTGSADGPSKGDFGPYFQSRRRYIYQKHVEELQRKGLAYEHEGTVKFKMSRDPIQIPDLVVGHVTRELTDRESLDPDFIIVRSDGQPVFHLVNVIDDLEMGITHVIRGEDHLSNTAKHMALFHAFGASPPQYAHIPLILNQDGSKMGKRDKGASLRSYMEEGYVPEAVVNFLYLLGWSPKGNREIVPLSEVISLFDLPDILRHNARFDMTKMQWMNAEYLRQMSLDRFCELAIPTLAKAGINLSGHEPAYITAAVATAKEKVKLLVDLPSFIDFYFVESVPYDAEKMRADFTPETRPRVMRLREAFAQLDAFDAADLERTLKAVASELGIKVGLLVHPVRLACTGKTIGPSLYHLLEVLGKERVLKRLDDALSRFA
ncbi:MAG: glutamate--tRNA ligase family protein [Verrucomicrobiota bacterium]